MTRRTTILAATDLGASGTKVIDVTEKSQISRIMILFTVTLNTVSVMLNTLRKTVSKVELVDGGRVLYSASGDAIAGVNFFETGKLPFTHLSLTAADIAIGALELNFGRWLFDNEFALRPEMFANPQLRITYDEDACNTGAAANTFAVYADVIDNPPGGPSAGMLVTKDVQSYVFTASGHEYVNLPTDYPMRALFIKGHSIDHDTPALFGQIRVELNNGAMVLVDHGYTALCQIARDLGAVTLPVVLDAAVTACDLYVPMRYLNKIAIDYDATAFVTAQSKFALPAYKGPFIDVAASVDIKKQTGIVTGYLPGGVLPVSFGNPGVPDSWLAPSPADDLRADILASSDADSGDECEVLVQQAMRY